MPLRARHLSASSFVDHPDAARHLRRHGGRTGDLFPPGRGRWRIAEYAQAALGLHPVSNLNLVGGAQVGKSSLTGMRMLHQLGGRLPVWPVDADPGHGSLLVEIYTSLAAREAGGRVGRSKLRDITSLNQALATLGSAFIPLGALNSAINLAIATAKALLVAWFFMHLRSGHAMLRITAAAFRTAMERSATLRALLLRYALAFHAQVVSGEFRPISTAVDAQPFSVVTQHHGMSSSIRLLGQPLTRRVSRSAR